MENNWRLAMPWRMLGLIIILAVLLAFIGFNLDNRCDLSLGLISFRGVPIYLTVFASFVLGMLCSLPYIILKYIKKREKKVRGKDQAALSDEALAAEQPDVL
jgi:uncharacterized integral membrane protein